MLPERICRACRLRLFGLAGPRPQPDKQALPYRSSLRHGRPIATSTANSAGEDRSPHHEYETRFPAPDHLGNTDAALPAPEIPALEHLAITDAGLPAPEIPASEPVRERIISSWRRRSPYRHQNEATTPTDSITQQMLEGRRDSPISRRFSEKRPPPRRQAAFEARFRDVSYLNVIPPNPTAPQPERLLYHRIRRTWKIPDGHRRRDPIAIKRTRAYTRAYWPVFAQRHHAWGYYRHILSNAELSKAELHDAKKIFNRWFYRLGFVVVEPHTVEETQWRHEASWLLKHSSIPTMCAAWERLDIEERRRKWPDVMLSTMISSPDRTVDVLLATMSPLPPGYAVRSVLDFVTLNLGKNWPLGQKERRTRADEIIHVMEEVLTHFPKGHIRPSQRTLGIFAKVLPPGQTKMLYDLILRSKTDLKENPALHFADTLSKDAEYKQVALDILLEMARKGTDLNEPRVASVVTTLLHCQHRAAADNENIETAASFSKTALEALMEHGLIPNLISLTSFLDTLCWEGETEEAVRLALLFVESGASMDSRTFATVFKAAKQKRDPELMRQALEVAKAAKAPVIDVLNNALHAVFYVNEVESKEAQSAKREWPQAFEPMLRLYSQKFSLEPLQWLLPTSLGLMLARPPPSNNDATGPLTTLTVTQAFFRDTNAPRLEPNTTTLALMLRSYIRSIRHPKDVAYFYEYFKRKLEDRVEGGGFNHARAVVKDHGSLIHDTVLLTMMNRLLPTRQVLQVLGDMLRDNLPEPAAQAGEARDFEEAVEEKQAPVHPAPSVLTLNILIMGLLLRKEAGFAEQLMDVMRENGMEPDLTTWNSLVKGFAMMQDVPRTVSALQQLEAAGHEADDRTYKAFGYLRNQSAALALMDKIIQTNKARLEEEDLYSPTAVMG